MTVLRFGDKKTHSALPHVRLSIQPSSHPSSHPSIQPIHPSTCPSNPPTHPSTHSSIYPSIPAANCKPLPPLHHSGSFIDPSVSGSSPPTLSPVHVAMLGDEFLCQPSLRYCHSVARLSCYPGSVPCSCPLPQRPSLQVAWGFHLHLSLHLEPGRQPIPCLAGSWMVVYQLANPLAHRLVMTQA